MNPLYIDSQRVGLGVEGFSLYLKDLKTKTFIEKFSPRNIPYDSIFIQRPNGFVSFAALNWLVKHAVSLTILNWRGNILAQFLPEEPLSNELKLAQYKTYLDREKHVQTARTIVETKLRRQRDLVSSLSVSYPLTIPKIESINETSEDFIRNQEARYATEYFKQFGIVCKELGHSFNGRNQTKSNMHAPDLPNGLLNYSYALLQTYVRRAINSIGLDNAIPFLHDLRRNHGLVYDLMELWRTNCDYSVLQTLESLNAKKRNHYLTDGYEVLLKRETVNLLFETLKLNLSLEEILFNSRILAKFILGESKNLRFALKPIRTKGNFENTRVKEIIISKTARELGMNKSSHWYQRKRLLERGSVKLYGKTKQYFA